MRAAMARLDPDTLLRLLSNPGCFVVRKVSAGRGIRYKKE